MNVYMGYSRILGCAEGAVLVFAHTAKEARNLTFKNGLVVDDWTDTAVRKLRDNLLFLFDSADKEKLARDEPHVIDDPPTCRICSMWGQPINEDGLCPECDAEVIVTSQV